MLTRILGALALLLVLSLNTYASVDAQSAAQLTVHARICPNDQIPSDFFATCHDEPITDLEFFLDDVSAGTTGSDGNLTVDVVGDSVALSGGVPGEFARNFIYCSSNADQSIEVAFAEVTPGDSVTVPVGSAGTTCDWYAVPFDLKGDDPTPTPTPTDDDDVTQLPNTGLGSSDGSSALPVVMAIVAIMIAATGLVVRRERI